MKLIDALTILKTRPPAGAPVFRLALVCGFSPLHLHTFLHAELQQLFPDHQIEIVGGLYGDITGTMDGLKPDELDAVALVIEWSDLDARLGIRQLGGWGPGNLDSILERSRLWLMHLQLLIEKVSRSVPVAVSLPTLPLPPLFFSAGWQASSVELDLKKELAVFASAISQLSRVRVLNTEQLDRDSPASARLNVKSDWASGFPYQLPHASTVARLVALLLKRPVPKKGLITDLDNTLWNGIVGEVGVEAVYWDQDHKSEAHGYYQQMLKTLSEEGTLIAAASKNDPAIAETAFQRSDLILAKENLSMLDVSWGSKARAVSRIIEKWNIGADSVVFIDDSPLELAEVKAAHPEVECILFPYGNPQGVYDLVLRLRDLFGKERVSEEDQLRAESIRRSAAIKETADDGEGFSDALLEQAGAELTISLQKNSDDARAFELINKTNQFNLNGKRFTEAVWQKYLEQQNTFVLTASYKDKFGSLGKIAVITGRNEQPGTQVDTWVMSCRAFARRIEHQCLKTLFDKLHTDEIVFDFAGTSRNGPISRFLSEFLGDSPTTPVTISRTEFDKNCPPLFHRVVELNHE
jgi:FkbH-like protein